MNIGNVRKSRTGALAQTFSEVVVTQKEEGRSEKTAEDVREGWQLGLLPSAFLKFVCLNQSLFPNQSPEADTRGGDWLVALAD